MNAKLLYAATLAVALLGSGAAMASEATQFNVPASTQTRANVKTELGQAMAKGQLPRSFETDQRALQPAATASSMRARAEVRAEARSAARRHEFNPNYIGA